MSPAPPQPQTQDQAPDKIRNVPGVGPTAFPASMTDEQINAAIQKAPRSLSPTGQVAKPPVAQNALAPPTEYKPQDITGKDVKAAAVNAIPMAGGFVGGLAGGIPGAAMGGAAGEAAKEALVSKVGYQNLSGEHWKVEPPPGSLREASKNIAWAGFEQGAFEGAGTLAAKLMRGALGGAMSIEGRSAENALIKEASEKYGLNLTAMETAGRFHIIQRAGEYSAMAQGFIQKKWGESAANGIKAIDNLLLRLNPPTSPQATLESLQGILKASHELFQQAATDMYEKQLKPIAGNILINMRPVKAEAQRMLEKIAETKSLYESLGTPGAKGEKMLTDIVASPDDAPFSAVHEMRSNLMTVSPDVDALMASKIQGAAKKLVGETTNAIDTSLGAANPKARALWNQSREFYKDGADLFQHEAITGLMKKNPSQLANIIKPHDVGTVQAIKEATLDYAMQFGDPSEKQAAAGAWRQFQEQFFRTNILQDPEHVGLPLNPQELAKIGQRMDEMGPGVIKEIYGDTPGGREAVNNIRTISEAFSRVQKLPVEGRRYVYDMLEATTNPTAAAGKMGVFALQPSLITKAIHNKMMTGYLLDGIGGLMKASKYIPAQKLGKGLIHITEHSFTSEASYNYLGKALANFARAGVIYRELEKKESASTAKAPPGAGNQPDHIQIMIDDWSK